MTPTYNIVPGERVGPFQLGTFASPCLDWSNWTKQSRKRRAHSLGESLWQVLELVRTEKTAYPKAEVKWDDTVSALLRSQILPFMLHGYLASAEKIQQPHKSPVVISLPQLSLHFETSPRQALTRITVSELATTHLTLTYDAHTLCGPSATGRQGQKLSRGLIGKFLGPTYDSKGSEGKLEYPGVVFHIDGQATGGRDDVVDLMVVTLKSSESPIGAFLAGCAINSGRGVTLSFPGSPDVEIAIGQTTAQDVLLDLGSPLRRFWKEDERMNKMWGGVEAGAAGEQGGEYFMNYFQHGLDFLISPDGSVKKIIAYSNIPGSALFQRYAKCPWSLSSSSGDLTSTSPLAAFQSALSTSSKPAVPTIVEPSPPPTPASETLAIPTSKKAKKRSSSANSDRSSASDVSVKEPAVVATSGAKEGGGDVQGMTLDRIGEGGLEGVTADMRSRLVGFEGLVVEEDLASGGIASALVYKP